MNTMRKISLKFSAVKASSVGLLCAATLYLPSVNAQQNMASYTARPPLSEKVDVNPMVMLTLSGDHQLFLKAYSDYDDLNNNKVLDLEETTYNRNFRYVGYFDSAKCYQYNETERYFEPTANAPVNGASVGHPSVTLAQYCPGATEWSGNYLNWSTMTRMDIIRHVLYGGYRSTDTTEKTVLERAFLPNDAHSFAKYLSGTDIHLLTPFASDPADACAATDASCRLDRGITLCNTTVVPNTSAYHNKPSQHQDIRALPPLARAVKGNYSLWATSERYQCLYGVAADGDNNREFNIYPNAPFGRNENVPAVSGIYAHSRNPPLSARTGAFKDYIVRVNVCGANSAGGINDCKTYGSVKKPVGIIQNYAEDRNVDFGLMSRSFNVNKADGPLGGGVLRRNIGKIASEINPTTGQFLKPSESLITSLDALRIVDYMFRGDGVSGDDFYNYGTYNRTCPWHSSGFNEGQCRNWGNPFGQIIAESYRYFAGASGPSITPSSDATLPPGLTAAAQWQDPLPAAGQDVSCINFNVIGFNASAGSFDNDAAFANATPASLGVGRNEGSGALSLKELTNRVGEVELADFPTYFVGKATTLANEANGGQCSPKAISEFGNVSGTCPDAPRLGGSYLMAGLAHYVKTHDVRAGQRAGSEFSVNTYGVTMASNLPTIKVRNPNNELQVVHVIPACRNLDNFRNATPTFVGNCALVDFRAVPDATGRITKYFVAWEDTEHGSDYDQDLPGIIEIRFNADGSFDVVTSILGRERDGEGRFYSTPDHMEFGFVISGSTSDNIYFPSWVNRNRTQHEWDPKITNFRFGSNSAESNFLEPPLYYAAKWGSYKEEDNIDGPNLDSEWKGEDGWPTGYTLVRRPDTLQERLEGVLNNLINKSSTSTSASIESSRLAGEGLMLQTLYNPEVKRRGKTVTWVGTLNGLFIDAKGNIREDTNGNKRLDAGDSFIEFVTSDDNSGQTLKFNRYPVGTDGGPNRAQPSGQRLDLEQLKTLWSARDALADITSANVVLQRGETELAQNKRLILAGLDRPTPTAARDGIVGKNEVVAFTPANIPSAVLDVPEADAAKVVNYIRGLEVEGYRSRTINWGSGEKVWRLGDIVHSTPSIVGRPADGYDARYGDDSYIAFREKYRNRRNMVYVGANDGMLHAFNAGFYVKDGNGNHSYMTKPSTQSSVREHALGAEMWAYVPYNLLPHLKWLTRNDYSHVYYVDSKIHTFDVNIFHGAGYDNNVYPNGWGTILVAGMRFGGGEYNLNLDGSSRMLRSAYVIMDITDPEQPPKLIAEITDAQLGFTTGDVELVKRRSSDGSGSYLGTLLQNDWHLVFGSGPRGPHAVSDAISDQQAKLFYFDLNGAIAGNLALTGVDVDAPTQKSFVHAIKSVDWNRDYKDDMLYVGILGDHGRRTSPAPENPYHGALKHVDIQDTGAIFDESDVATLLTGTGTNLPFSGTPLTVRDRSGNFWVFANTGQFLVKQDLNIPVRNKYFGIKVNSAAPNNLTWLTNESVSISSLYDVTGDLLLMSEGEFGAVKVRTQSHGVENLSAYENRLSRRRPPYSGWYRDLEGSDATSFTRTAFLNNTVIFNSYSPGVSSCEQRGRSNIYLLDMFTGLPQHRRQSLYEKSDGTISQIDGQNFKEIGAVAVTLSGVASDPAIINNHVITQTDTGEISNIELDIRGTPIRRAWREIPVGEINITITQ